MQNDLRKSLPLTLGRVELHHVGEGEERAAGVARGRPTGALGRGDRTWLWPWTGYKLRGGWSTSGFTYTHTCIKVEILRVTEWGVDCLLCSFDH